ncbi:MAG: guanine deaminase [Spongiibacteraceae bacterium]
MTARQTLLLGQTISFSGDPFLQSARDCFDYCRSGAILIEGGKITAAGEACEIKKLAHADVTIEDFGDAIISAGFIDTHVHYPQTQMVASYGEQLLQWLEKYTFIVEQQFAEKTHAERIAEFFLRELLRNGTTTAAVYCTVHPQSVDAFFEQSHKLNTLMIAGKVLMDRNAPAALLDTPERAYEESKTLIERWHNHGRQRYCITPRFAGTSSPAQLDIAAQLWRESPGTYLQTHMSENLAEVAWMRELFPTHKNYLDIYASHNLLGPRSIYAHCIHVDENDFCAFHQHGATIAHCPTSNLFLGSGLFNLKSAKNPTRPVRVGLGSDIGAGTSFSQLQSLNEAYKIAQLRSEKLDPIRAFYLATRGGAEALYLDDRIGSLTAGNDADLVVLNPHATPLLKLRSEQADSIEDLLFALMMLGDDRAVLATYVAGERVQLREH